MRSLSQQLQGQQSIFAFRAGLVAASVLLAQAIIILPVAPAAEHSIRTVETDLLVVGATESGWAAAIQAARMGIESIVIVHDGRWFGGQFTEQALACVDENKGVGRVGWGVDWHPMKRSFHRSGLFKELMDRIEAFNKMKYGSEMPGRPYHGPSTFQPAEAEAIFREMIQPWIDRGQIRVFWDRYPVAADVRAPGIAAASHPKLRGLSFAPLGSQRVDLRITADITIDASDWGEAVQLSGAAFECGPDPKSRLREPSAPGDLAGNPPNEMNPITWTMIIEQSDRQLPIERPHRFDDRNFARTSKISLDAMRHLDWDRPVRLSSIPHWPDAGTQAPRQLSVYTVRRLVEGTASKRGRTVILLAYMLGQDYPLERLPQHVVDALEATEPGASRKNIVRMTRRQRQIIYGDARRHSLSLLYHLQNFVHDRATDKANSFRGFRLSDQFGTPDRLPPKPYIRESLRLKAMYMMREQDGRNSDGETKKSARERFARVIYPDGVFCWQFHYDFHRTGRAYLSGKGQTGPWIDFEKPGRHTHHVSDRSVFPLRSLIPQKMDGLLGAQKNLGYSSIVCAAIRLHDQCVAVGQAAGAAAAIAINHNTQPREIPYDRRLLEDVRHGLCGPQITGVPLLLYPFRDLAPNHSSFIAVNRLAAIGIVTRDETEVDFRPEGEATIPWQQSMIALADQATGTALLMETRQGLTRGEFCRDLWQRIESMPLRPFPRRRPDDADDDGIANQDDPTPFTRNPVVVWAVRPPGPTEDGLLEAMPGSQDVRRFNFTPLGSAPVDGFVNDDGRQFRPEAGHGWNAAISQNSRRRKILDEDYRDTFLFTRQSARWECIVDNGTWQVTLCVGDAAHGQPGQRVTVEGRSVIDDVTTAAGRFLEATTQVEVVDGRLTVDLGPQTPGHNTCINWIQINRRAP